MLQQIVEWMEDKNIFCRKRKTNEERAMGILLYHAGLSYEKTGLFLGVSYEAVRKWIIKGRELFSHTVVKKERARIAVDEKIIKRGNEYLYLWAAVNLGNEHVIAVSVTTGRSYLEAMRFLRRVKQVCKGKLPRIFVDGGVWYPWALQRVGFTYSVVCFGPRSAVEWNDSFHLLTGESGDFGKSFLLMLVSKA